MTINGRKDSEGKMKYTLYVPGANDDIPLAPSDGAAQLTTPQAILDKYQAQHGMKKLKGSSK